MMMGRLSNSERSRGGFDIRFRIAAQSSSEYQIHNHAGIVSLPVSLRFWHSQKSPR